MNYEYACKAEMDDEACPTCGDCLIIHSDVYDIYPGHFKYVKWKECLSCGYYKVLKEQDF